MIPRLTDEQVKEIHNTSMRILEKEGIYFYDEKSLQIFKKHGFKVENNVVNISESQVWDALETVPKQFSIRARKTDYDLTVGTGVPVFSPGGGATDIVDFQGIRRLPLWEDYLDLVRLAHMLPNIDLTGHGIVEKDVFSDVRMLYAHMVLSDKPFNGSVRGRIGAKHTMEMCRILFGNLDNPYTIGTINPTPPLGYAREMSEALITYAKKKQPLNITPLAMAGSTGPATLAGTAAQQNAETLAGIVLTQLVNPGTPVIYGGVSTNMDMATGNLSIGSPEAMILTYGLIQLVNDLYGDIPIRSGGVLTDACEINVQAGFESMYTLLLTVLGGVDFILHTATLDSYLAISPVILTINEEMVGMVKTYLQGMKVTDESLAYPVIQNVGHGGNFLFEDHTLAHCREFFTANVAFKGGRANLDESGKSNPIYRAMERAKSLINEHKIPYIDSSTASLLNKYVKEHS